MAIKKKILIVDDDEAITKTLALVLKKAGYEPDTFNRPDDALDAFKKEHYACVISDYNMPGMDGLELLQELKNMDPKIKTIIASGEHNFRHLEESGNFYVNGYLHKPFDSEVLNDKLLQVLEN